MSEKKYSEPDSKRFEVSTWTLRADAFMTHFIKIGGIGVIGAVFAIFFFILSVVLPLFTGASIKEDQIREMAVQDPAVLGADEWTELPFVVDRSGVFHFVDLVDELQIFGSSSQNREVDLSHIQNRGVFQMRPDFLTEDLVPTVIDYNQNTNTVVYGTDDGKVGLVNVNYAPEFLDGGARRINAQLKTEKLIPLVENGVAGEARVVAIDYLDGLEYRLIAGITENSQGERSVHVVSYRRKTNLFGKTTMTLDQRSDISDLVEGDADKILVSGRGDALIVGSREGAVNFLLQSGANRTFGVEQVFYPFGSEAGAPGISNLGFLQGSAALSITSTAGDNLIFGSYRDEQAGRFVFKQFREMPALDGPVQHFANSLRNRAYILTSGSSLSLRFSTTGAVRWSGDVGFEPTALTLGAKYEDVLLMDDAGRMHVYSLNDPHPEAGFSAFFRKIWYEGLPEPSYVWSSTGGSSEFQPKLSMIPLLVGTLKGTFYALLFAVPIGVLAACYTSQFLAPSLKRIVKPTMEIMASLPSVVLGFLAALWLAPIIEDKFPSVLSIIILVPAISMLVGWSWSKAPQRIRRLIPNGWEFLAFTPILLISLVFAWELGPLVERLLFVVVMEDGSKLADFRLWWTQATGMDYNQRNAMVVGFMMGFAVIPIIFTISEDAMSNVPVYLTSASLALGASRWQTALRIVLPTASPGVFSALMIGLGRAVGETMIVVMATGNTAVLGFNPFEGFRAFSANIAVELPEAPVGATLYRTLFLCALLLFILTFTVNSIAEITRSRLREKYKTVG